MISLALQKTLDGFRLEASCELPATRFSALLGPSGCGKATLAACLAGLCRPESGFILINGKTFFSSEEGVWLTPQERGIGYVFQSHRLFPHLTVRGNLFYGRQAGRRSDIDPDALIEVLGIGALLDRRPRTLSSARASSQRARQSFRFSRDDAPCLSARRPRLHAADGARADGASRRPVRGRRFFPHLLGSRRRGRRFRRRSAARRPAASGAFSSSQLLDLEEAARVHGASEARIFLGITLPLIRPSLAVGLLMGCARVSGEVGITMMLGGNISGKTNTLSLEIFNAVSRADFDVANALCVVLSLFAALLFIVMEIILKKSIKL